MGSQFGIVKELGINGKKLKYYSLPALREAGHDVSRLPVSIRIILESLIRNHDGRKITDEHIKNLLNWKPDADTFPDVPFTVSRVVMQDFTGVPAVVDLAAMRDTMSRLGRDPDEINPEVQVDLVIDHSVQVDSFGLDTSFTVNRRMEFDRNGERYRFLKWAQKSFSNFRVVPPSTGIVHQVNLEYLGQLVMEKEIDGEKFAIPDSLVGTDSHTTMINGLGIVGWGVGGIEAEAAILGEPVSFLTPQVVGVNLHEKPREGVTATDIVLTLTEILRKAKVVGKFVEFFGDGVESLSVTDRATLSNMCPEYGATMALFPVDTKTIEYLKMTGRSEEHIEMVEQYFRDQGLFGVPKGIQYSELIDLDLSSVISSVAGPKLPQQKLSLPEVGNSFLRLIEEDREGTAGKSGKRQITLQTARVDVNGSEEMLSEGDVVIAAITSCTNTSNPRVMIGAGLLAKKAVERGLNVNRKVKTSLAPGSRVVSEYLEKSGLQEYLNRLGFYLVGYGCTTCIGNSGPLNESIEKAVNEESLYVSAVLSGNRNFEARIHKDVRANYLMSPPLVVAYAIAGTVLRDLSTDPVGKGENGEYVYLKDIWPSDEEITEVMNKTITREMFVEKYRNVGNFSEEWNSIEVEPSKTYKWDKDSTYIRNPPFFDSFSPSVERSLETIEEARPLLILGDSVTTDHISPAGSIPKSSPAGEYLIRHGVEPKEFNSFGSRRGNHEVMMRGTFGNTRIRNELSGKEGGFTKTLPDGKDSTVFDASVEYAEKDIPLIVFAGKEYGTGSSRDWAAKGPLLLGIRATVAISYERIHRSNLVGMGIIPLQFKPGDDFQKLDADIGRPFRIEFSRKGEGYSARMSYTSSDGTAKTADLLVRLDSDIELEYFRKGGILQFAMANKFSS